MSAAPEVYEADTLADWLAMCAENGIRACAGCGCTDGGACADEETGKACYWVEQAGIDICSVCARLALAVERDAAKRAPRVQLYTEGDANLAIAAMRSGLFTGGL